MNCCNDDDLSKDVPTAPRLGHRYSRGSSALFEWEVMSDTITPHFINLTPTKFRGAQGHLWTERLFWEPARSDKSSVLYTLAREDRVDGEKVYPSLYRLYMEVMDPTEYAFAVKYFEGWDHWQAVAEAHWMKPLITSWRRELEVKIRSQALNRIISAASGTGKEAATLNRFLVEGGYTVSRSTKGRPSKAEVAQAAHEEAMKTSDTLADAKRLGIIN